MVNKYLLHKYFHQEGQLAYDSKLSYYTVPGQSIPKWLTSTKCKNTFTRRGQLAYDSKVSYYIVPGQSFPKWLTST